MAVSCYTEHRWNFGTILQAKRLFQRGSHRHTNVSTLDGYFGRNSPSLLLSMATHAPSSVKTRHFHFSARQHSSCYGATADVQAVFSCQPLSSLVTL